MVGLEWVIGFESLSAEVAVGCGVSDVFGFGLVGAFVVGSALVSYLVVLLLAVGTA